MASKYGIIIENSSSSTFRAFVLHVIAISALLRPIELLPLSISPLAFVHHFVYDNHQAAIGCGGYMASNNEIVSGFDDEKDNALLITLETEAQGALCAHLKGTLDTANCNIFDRKMKKALKAGFLNIVIECSALNYLSSAGVGALAAILKQTKEKDGSLALKNVSSEAKELLKLLDFEQFFEIIDGAKDETPAPKADSDVKEALPPAAFPLVITCPACGKALKVPKAGRYRCSNCKAVITVANTGNVHLG